MVDDINSLEHWDQRFKGDWDSNKGDRQSIFFAEIALELFPGWLNDILEKGASFCDWGCAEGDGTSLFAKKFPKSSFIGIDFASSAINVARSRYKQANLRFEAVDLLQTDYDKSFDIVFSSNVFEHFEKPFAIFEEISRYASDLFVMMVPFEEDPDNLIPEHMHSFSAIDFKLRQGDWVAIHFEVKDVEHLAETYWGGKQALVVFARGSVLELLDLTFGDVSLTADASLLDVKKLQEQIKNANKIEQETIEQALKAQENNTVLSKQNEQLSNELSKILSDSQAVRLEVDKLRSQVEHLNSKLQQKATELNGARNELNSKRYRVLHAGAVLFNRVVGVNTMRRKVITLPLTLKDKIQHQRLYLNNHKVIIDSGQFDAEFYLINNPDVKNAGIDPLKHYILYGQRELRMPNENFDPKYYLDANPDVKNAGIDPLKHYILWGKNEKRPFNKKFETPYGYDYKRYIDMWRGGKEYLLNEKAQATNKDVRLFLEKFRNYNKMPIMVLPLSYPLDMAQRPDHFFRCLTERNMPTLLLEFDFGEKYIREHRPGVFVTNMFGAALKFLETRKTVLYMIYPFYSYFVGVIKPNALMYDVLDDLSCFSGNRTFLKEEHEWLLSKADIVLYSSKTLQSQNKDLTNAKQWLVENGVWVDDFRNPKNINDRATARIAKKDEIVIGYYGAVSNLLDWDLLCDIALLPKVRLAIIGPRSEFPNVNAPNFDAKREKVLQMESVTYMNTIPYEALPYYSSQFDAAIVPFVINDVTNPVSPLKLFEYMAAGHKVFATPTTTLKEYDDVITVEAPDKLLKEIGHWTANFERDNVQKNKYSTLLSKIDWATQFESVVDEIEKMSSVPSNPLRFLRIDIINVNFFDWDGKRLFKGGAERYVLNLAQNLQKMGISSRLLQNAKNHFQRNVGGVDVIGVETGHIEMRGMSSVFNEVVKRADMAITSPLDLSSEIKDVKTIGISHGIYWDSINNGLGEFSVERYRGIFDALSKMYRGVCVDTNFINWVRTYDYPLSKKLAYIPNYYDKNEFVASKKDFSKKLTIIFPRRLCEERGLYLTIEAFKVILKKRKDIDLIFVGQFVDKKAEKSVKTLMQKYETRVTHEMYEMDNMPLAYKKSHIVLIPTLYAEGTSLSCLEAMATNNAVIATNVGGLSNIIIDGYNGLLIEPNSEALIEAVDKLASDRIYLKRVASKGLSVVEEFSKDRWDTRWKAIIEDAVKS